MVKTNRQLLTGGKKYKQNLAKKHAAEEIIFDKDSRLEFLTGFHKRKLERQKKAKEFAKEQERLQKIEERRKLREGRKAEIADQLKKLKDSMLEIGDYHDVDIDDNIKDKSEELGNEEINSKSVHSNGFSGREDIGDSDDAEVESWNGFSDVEEEVDGVKPILKKHKKVYDDETTVEIEPLEPNDNLEYLAQLNNVKLENSQKVLDECIDRAKKYAKFLGMDDKPAKQKKKKFRYLTKAERRSNQRKANANKRRR